jgi:hypothetical protein
MKSIRTLGLSVMAALAFSAIVAAAAQAIQGPYFRVEGKALPEGQTKALKAKAANTFVIKSAVAKITIVCKKMKLAEGAVINGEKLKNPDTSDQRIEFEECTVEGNGTPCEPEGKKIVTNTLIGTPAYGEAAPKKGTPMLWLFAPKTGTVIVKVKFAGVGCTVPEAALEGSVGAEAWSGEKITKVEEEPAETVKQEWEFPKAAIAALWVEKEGVTEEMNPKLKLAGAAATLEGRSAIELGTGEKWEVSAR